MGAMVGSVARTVNRAQDSAGEVRIPELLKTRWEGLLPHRYDYRVYDLRDKTTETVHEVLNRAAKDGFRLLPMAYHDQQHAIFERPHEEDEFESMSEEEKARWFAENVEYNRVDDEWQGSN
jgi:magnesium-transporting ATPase (P-type)